MSRQKLNILCLAQIFRVMSLRAVASITAILLTLAMTLMPPAANAAGVIAGAGKYKYSIRESSAVYSSTDAVVAARTGALLTPPTQYCTVYGMVPAGPWRVASEVEGQERMSYQVYTYSYGMEQEKKGCVSGFNVGNAFEMARVRVVCTKTEIYVETFDRCVPITPVDPPGQTGKNGGPSCGSCPQGQPIDPGTGNMWHVEKDHEAGSQAHGLAVTRTYNSKYPVPLELSPSRGFGQGWTNEYGNYMLEVPLVAGFKDSVCYKRSDNGEIVCDEARSAPSSPLPLSVALARGDGKRFIFQKNSSGKWTSSADVTFKLDPVFSLDGTAIASWIFTAGKGDVVERYNARGLLTSVTYANGGTQRYTYSMGQTNDTSIERSPVDAPVCNTLDTGPLLRAKLLLCVTDNWGRQLNFKYDEQARISEVIDPAGQITKYSYDGPSGGCFPQEPGGVAPDTSACTANNLTMVTYPDGKSRTYYYNEADRINGGLPCTAKADTTGFALLLNAMTGRVDENGDRHISWTYDCAGNATSSALAGGVEKVVLAYTTFPAGNMEATVTHTVGDPANPQTTVGKFVPVSMLGMTKNKSISTPCRECGKYADKTYDLNGNLTLARDFNGAYTTFKYDLARNLQTQMVLSPYDSSMSLTTSTQWHPTLPLPAKVAEPLRMTDYAYDTVGRLLKRMEQATTDTRGSAGFLAASSGLPRAWSYTYNDNGQVLTVTGPRTDVIDRTTYDYDPVSGNLATITNALGHVTRYVDYKPDGKVGTIIAPNGTTTTYTYTFRGLVETTSIYDGETTETTAYEYDGAGQLKKVTMPDGAFVVYGYDAAHRLTSIGDTLGNTVTYALDLSGNRLSEQTADPTGSLKRKISRVFNTLNQMTQQTGGAQ